MDIQRYFTKGIYKDILLKGYTKIFIKGIYKDILLKGYIKIFY